MSRWAGPGAMNKRAAGGADAGPRKRQAVSEPPPPGGLAIGTGGAIAGLKSAAQHNGKHCTVTGYFGKTGRYEVRLDGTGDKLALKPSNIVADGAAADGEALDDSISWASTAPGAAAAAAPAPPPPAAAAAAAAAPLASSRVLQLTNMLTAEDLEDPEEHADIMADIRAECEREGGAVASVIIPRVDDLQSSARRPPSVNAIGLCFVEFKESAAAAKAKDALHGRTFGENVVAVQFYPEDKFAAGELDDVRIAQPAAGEAAAAAAAAAKEEEEPALDVRRVGTVSFFNPSKGFGFIGSDGDGGAAGTEKGLFVHRRSLVTQSPTANLSVGQRVSYVLTRGADGRMSATDVRDPDGVSPVDAAAYEDKAEVSVYSDSMTGRKDSQEDRYTNALALPRRLGKWVGVYDGHGGQECSEFLAAHLHKSVESVWQGQPSASAMTAAFSDGFRQTESGFMELAARRNLRSGSTACVVLLHGWEPPRPEAATGGAAAAANLGRPCTLWVANLGDSRAVLCRGGKALRLSEDHKPERRDEKKRVEAAGGFVMNIGGIWRVTNSAGGLGGVGEGAGSYLYLAVSRAFGDSQLKGVRAGSQSGESIVSAVPEVKSFDVEPDDLFAVVACDGVWDVLSDQEVVDLAAEHWPNAEEAAKAVTRQAYIKGSGDNLTASVMVFEWNRERGDAVLEARKERQRKTEEEEEEIDMFG